VICARGRRSADARGVVGDPTQVVLKPYSTCTTGIRQSVLTGADRGRSPASAVRLSVAAVGSVDTAGGRPNR
jgi:hypothetical protein